MTYVVTDACIRCKYMDCVAVCPVDCFHEGDSMLAIDPEKCIDCGVCQAECPVGAIIPDTAIINSNKVDLASISSEQKSDKSIEFWVQFNRKCSKKWKNITTPGIPPKDADEWRDVGNKLDLIKEELESQNIFIDNLENFS